MNVTIVTPGADPLTLSGLVQFLPWGQTVDFDRSGLLVSPLSYHSFVGFGWVHNEFFLPCSCNSTVIQSNASFDTAVANVVINPARPLRELKVFPLN